MVFPIVEKIKQQVGDECWVDLDGIESSMQFRSVICQAIDKAEIVLFMHSATHLSIDFQKDFTIKELNYAEAKGKRIVLVKLDDAALENVFLMEYGSKNNIDSNDARQFNKLINDLKVWLNTSDKGPEISGESYTVTVGKVVFDLIRVEGGTMTLGNRKITLPTYFMGKFPVTQNLWQEVMGENCSINQRHHLYPVENLTYYDAKKFVCELSKRTDIPFDLPTELEWEYAARGGQKSKGYLFSGSNIIDDVAWYARNSSNRIHVVGQKLPNELGIYDMCGNVWEWTKTFENGKYIRRGGSWYYRQGCCQVSYRKHTYPSRRTAALGLRIVVRENIK